MIRHRDAIAERYGVKLLVYTNPEGVARGINPIASGLAAAHPGHEDRGAEAGAGQVRVSMPPSAARGATRRRAGPRSASSPSAPPGHVWDPRNQRPELWHLYNTRINKGETIRVFPLSNWTELDIWQYTRAEDIPVVPLYFAAPRPVVRARRPADHARRRAHAAAARRGRGDAHGALPLARLLSAVGGDREHARRRWTTSSPRCCAARTSERSGRLIDTDEAASMEKKKREGYF